MLMQLLTRVLGARPRPIIPQYTVMTRLRSLPALPEIREREAVALSTRHDAVLAALQRPPIWPLPDDGCFTSLGEPGTGLVTITGPSGPVLPLFTSSTKAEAYRLVTRPRLDVAMVTSSAEETPARLADGERLGLAGWTIDPCPHCNTVAVYGFKKTGTPEDVLMLWGISRATERLRVEVHLQHALELANAGDFQQAKYVLMCCLQHVSLEEPQVHVLFGKLCVSDGPQSAVAEALTFLRFLRQPALAARLEADAAAGYATFDDIRVPIAEA